MVERNGWSIRTVISLVLALCFLTTLVPAYGERADDIGLIYGRVSDNVTKAPIDGAAVFLKGNKTFVTTDKSGDYALPGVEYGTYEVWAYKDGYDPTHVVIVLDQQSLLQDIYLEPIAEPNEGVVRGTVVLEDAASALEVDGAVVVVKPLDIAGGGEVIVNVKQTSTTGVGYYVLSLAPGNYSMECFAPNYKPHRRDEVKVDAAKVHYVDFFLEPSDQKTGTITGLVVEKGTDLPLGNATVIAYGMKNGMTAEMVTDQTGYFIFSDLIPEDYTVFAFRNGYEPGSNTTSVEAGKKAGSIVRLNPGVAGGGSSLLWGFVFGDGVRLDYGWVFTEDMLWAKSKLFGVPGLYALYPFPGGIATKVTAWAPKHYPDSKNVLVPAGGIKRQDFHLKYGQDEGSSFVFARVLKEPEMVPLGGASLSLSREDPLTGTVDFYRTIDLAASENTWTVFPVPKGTDYTVRSVHSSLIFTGYKVLPANIQKDDMDSFEVTSDAPVLLDIYMNGSVLPPGGNCTIWGYVMLDMLGGFPVIGADVAISPYDDEFFHVGTSGIYEYHVHPGTYSLLALFPGGYNVCPYDVDFGWWGIGEYTLTIYPGQTRHIDWVMFVRSNAHSTIAGHILDNTTHAPVRDFEIMASSASASMSYTRTGPSGYFLFSPITYTDIIWTLIGGHSLSDVVRVEYRYMPIGPWTTSHSLPVSFDVPPSSLVYVNIYVDPIGPNDLNSSVIWGYVHKETPSGALLPGTLVTIWPYSDDFIYSSSDGFYSYEVPHGDYLMQAVYPGMKNMLSLDLATGTWGIWLWVGTLAPGESRHVDIIITFEARNGSTIAGRVLNAADGSAIHGYRIKAYTDTFAMPVQSTVHGFFTFTPITDLGGPWSLIGESADYYFVKAESRVLPSVAVTTTTTTPVTNMLSVGTTVWVDIYVNRTLTPSKGTLKGRVLESFTYRPLKGVTVLAYPTIEWGEKASETTTDDDGEFEFELYPGEYTIQTKPPRVEAVRPGLTAMVVGGKTLDVTLYIPPANLVPGLSTKMTFVMGKGVVRDVKVQIAGVGEFRSDATGKVSFLLGYRGNYTVTFSQKVDKIEKKDGTAVSFNADGTLPLIPGEEYKVTLTSTTKITKARSAELSDPLTVGLLIGVLLALIVGFVAGYAMTRGPRDQDIEE
jgi:hypothetical protein